MNIGTFVQQVYQMKHSQVVFPIQCKVGEIDIYFGTLAYFENVRIEEGIVVFWDDFDLIISPKFSKEMDFCSHCFLAMRNVKMIDEPLMRTSLVIDELDFFKEKILHAINAIKKLKQNRPLFPYYVISDTYMMKYNFFRVSECDNCLSKKQLIYNFENKKVQNTWVSPLSLRGKLADFSDLCPVGNKDFDFFKKEINVPLGNTISVEVQFFLPSQECISGIGIDNDYRKAKSKAVIEALERYCGISSKAGKRISKTLNDLNGEDRPYVNPNIYLEKVGASKISGTQKINWLSALDYRNNIEVLIPEDFIIYKEERTVKKNKIITISSNGHAMGNSFEEAVIFSIFEMIERDAFLYNWHNRKSPALLDKMMIEDKEVAHYIFLIEQLGYQLSIYKLLSTNYVNVYWTYAQGEGENKFATYSTAGAHLSNKTALISALKELYFALFIYDKDVIEIKAKARTMTVKDVKTVADHAIFYSVDERRSNFHFLETIPSISCSFEEEQEQQINLKEYYEDLLDYILQNFGEIYIADNTSKGIKELGLYEIKTFIPNMQEMSFGFENQYINKMRLNEGSGLDIPIHPFP